MDPITRHLYLALTCTATVAAIAALAAGNVKPAMAVPMITWPWVLLWCWVGVWREYTRRVSTPIRVTLFVSVFALLLNIAAYAFDRSADASWFGLTYVGVLFASVAGPVAAGRTELAKPRR